MNNSDWSAFARSNLTQIEVSTLTISDRDTRFGFWWNNRVTYLSDRACKCLSWKLFVQVESADPMLEFLIGLCFFRRQAERNQDAEHYYKEAAKLRPNVGVNEAAAHI